MNTINAQISKVTANPIGAIAGGALVFWGAKKYAGMSNNWMLGIATVVGVIGGAMVQSAMKAKSGVPTAATTK